MENNAANEKDKSQGSPSQVASGRQQPAEHARSQARGGDADKNSQEKRPPKPGDTISIEERERKEELTECRTK